MLYRIVKTGKNKYVVQKRFALFFWVGVKVNGVQYQYRTKGDADQVLAFYYLHDSIGKPRIYYNTFEKGYRIVAGELSDTYYVFIYRRLSPFTIQICTEYKGVEYFIPYNHKSLREAINLVETKIALQDEIVAVLHTEGN